MPVYLLITQKPKVIFLVPCLCYKVRNTYLITKLLTLTSFLHAFFDFRNTSAVISSRNNNNARLAFLSNIKYT